jgi:hypothetical protein
VPKTSNPQVRHDSADPALLGFAGALSAHRFADHRRRIPRTARPPDFGHLLRPGERLHYDVWFAGNPVGLAGAEIVAREPDPRGPPPRGAPVIVLEGHARTSGILSLLSAIKDDMTSRVDARSGAAVETRNVLDYEGWTGKRYRHRVTTTAHEGRGRVRIHDAKDDKRRKHVERVPIDTFDPLSAMAWVRFLGLDRDETAKAHAMDGTALLRIEVVGRGRSRPKTLPTIAEALGIPPGEIDMIEGTITRVDRFDQAIPGKRVYKLRAWLSDDDRRIPLVLESDMWVGSIRLELARYQPPH